MEAIAYKGFHIVIEVWSERTIEKKFQITGQIYQNPEETRPTVMRSWLAVREFASEQAAYEFGLRDARAWIDEQVSEPLYGQESKI